MGSNLALLLCYSCRSAATIWSSVGPFLGIVLALSLRILPNLASTFLCNSFRVLGHRVW